VIEYNLNGGDVMSVEKEKLLQEKKYLKKVQDILKKIITESNKSVEKSKKILTI